MSFKTRKKHSAQNTNGRQANSFVKTTHRIFFDPLERTKINYGQDSINPPYDSGNKADGGEEVSGEPIVSGCDASEVLEAAECVLNTMALLVGCPVEAEGLFAVRLVGNDGFGAALAEPLPQFGAVISSVAEHLSGCFGAPDQTLGWRTIVCLSSPLGLYQ
jgi:hypothetical protein